MKTSSMLMAGAVIASLLISESVFSGQNKSGTLGKEQSTDGTVIQTQESGSSGEPARHGKRHNGPVEMLGRFQFDNMAAQTISELTSQPIGTVIAKLKENRIPKVLKEYNITRDAFQAAMKPKIVALVQKRVVDGSITAEQQTLILKVLERKDDRREIMEKLIKSGVTAGIITQEEAERMLSKGKEEPPAE